MTFETLVTHGLEWAARGIEAIAALILLIGAARFVVALSGEIFSKSSRGEFVFKRARVDLGGYILAALEFLIVADILFTILRRTLEELYILALLTAIRTALSWFLTREIKELNRGDEDPR